MPDAYTGNHHFILHFLLHTQRHFFQSQFTQLKDILGFEEVIQCHGYFLRFIDFTGFQAGNEFFGSEVDVHHFIRFLQYTVRDTLFDFDAGDALNFFVDAFNVLDVDSGNHIDTFVQQIHHVLPTFLVSAAFYIGMRQFVYNDNIGMDTDNALQIHLFQFLCLVEYLPPRNDRKSFQ